MNAKELKSFRLRVTAQMAELKQSTEAIKREMKESSEVNPSAFMDQLDSAKGENELQEQVELYNRGSARLLELTAALNRIDGGTFGVCQECGEAIALRRLEARPGAMFCIECQAAHECLPFTVQAPRGLRVKPAVSAPLPCLEVAA